MDGDAGELGRAWARAVASPDWPERVLRALWDRFDSGEPLHEDVVLLDAVVRSDGGGHHVLWAVYRHPYLEQTLGFRRVLDARPAAGEPAAQQTLEAWLADWIAFEIAEPLGRRAELLVTDEQGIGWWGEGLLELPPLAALPPLRPLRTEPDGLRLLSGAERGGSGSTGADGGATYQRWTEDDRLELQLLVKRLPDDVRAVLRAGLARAEIDADSAGALARLDRLCEAFRRAPLVVVEEGRARLDVDDPTWVRAVLRT